MVERGGLCFARTLIAERLDQAEVRAMETVLLSPTGKFPSPGGTESDGKGVKMG